jgi:hypothetical protein
MFQLVREEVAGNLASLLHFIPASKITYDRMVLAVPLGSITWKNQFQQFFVFVLPIIWFHDKVETVNGRFMKRF